MDFKVPILQPSANIESNKTVKEGDHIDENKEHQSVPNVDVQLQEKYVEKTPVSKEKPKPMPSPAELMKQAQPLPYKEPSWSGLCNEDYSLEIIKNGVPVDTLKLSSKPFWVFGRLPQCDVLMEHPSLSRFHAIIQYCAVPTDQLPTGWYVFDLGSTHGTTLNKKILQPKVYHRLKVGYCIKFGGSTRLHIMQGPEDDRDVELSPAELAEMREKQKARQQEKQRSEEEAKRKEEEKGCSWGFGDDDEEQDPDAVNPFSIEIQEELQLDDPKKSLRGWYEREGYDQPEYIVEEQSHGRFRCIVELPVDTPTGHPLKAEVTVQGKKKEAVVQCALEACRLLDKQGVFRQSKHESRKRKAKNWEDNDYYDSDDDTFLDRTGDIEKKRQLRMKKAGKTDDAESSKALTYDQLVEQLESVEKEMADIQTKLDRSKQLEVQKNGDMDDLDAYMMSIKSGGLNATEKTKFKRRMIELKMSKARTERLITIAKPNGLKELQKAREEKLKQTLERQQLSQAVSPSDDKQLLQQTQNSRVEPHVETDTGDAQPNPHNDSKNKIPVDSDTNSEKNVQQKVKAEQMEVNAMTKHAAKPPAENVNNLDTKEENVYAEHVTSSYTPPAKHDIHSHTLAAKKVKKERPTVTVKRPNTSTKVPVATNQTGSKHSDLGLASMVQELQSKAEEEQLQNDPNYAGWLPPKNQTGDGRTALNDKLGY